MTTWRPEAKAWEAARFSEDGKRLRLIYVTSNGVPVDTANVLREQDRMTVTLSRMQLDQPARMAAHVHCVEVELDERSDQLVLIDGATGERADAKADKAEHFFTPTEFLRAREFRGDGEDD